MARGFALHRLHEIIDDYWLYGRCYACNARAPLDMPALLERFGKFTLMTTISDKLRCRQCGSKNCGLEHQHRTSRYYQPFHDPRG